MCIRLTLDKNRSIVSRKGEKSTVEPEVIIQEKHYSIGKEGKLYGQIDKRRNQTYVS